MDTRSSRRTRRLVIILSILVHILILLALFYATYQPSHNATLLPQRENDDEIIQILSQSTSNQGAQVVFDDAPEPPPSPAMQHQQPAPATPETTYDHKPALRQAQDERKEQLIEPLDLPEQKTPDVTFVAEKEQPQEQQKEIDTDALRQAQDERIEQQQPMQQPAQQKNSVTLAQITQGFLKSMVEERGRNESNAFDPITMAKQIYSTKVWTQLKRAVNADRLSINLQEDLHTRALIVIKIDERGNLLQAYLQHPKKTQGISAIERSIIQSTRSTGLFPPIPKRLDVRAITLRYPLMISCKHGTHTYSLMYK